MFHNYLDVRILGDRKYQVLSTLLYSDREVEVEVLPGFIFNGGNVPKILWGVIECPIGGKASRPFALHDILYGTKLVSRYMADRILYRSLLEEGIDRAEAISIYLAVRAAGGSAYDVIDSKTLHWEFIKIRTLNLGA